ncbi:MAG: NFACT family protein [Firmicutes bacterium]|nr:NFACT family protein [[Eubacterium] siraeum]MCM1488129.1 NFACT family protein [Bacillota bacterium]
MSLDGAYLSLIKQELINKGLIGSRIDKIHQPSREELTITLRGFKGAYKLALSANPSAARVCITEGITDNPQAPPMFCMLMRKHLSGGRLIDISQEGLERILSFDFECVNEIGDTVKNRISAELLGRCSNIILLTEKQGQWRVVDSIKRIGDDVSAVRRILPGIPYEAPPREDRLDVRLCEAEQARERLLKFPEQKLEKNLIKVFEGVSPILCREWAFYTARDIDAPCSCLEDKQRFERFSFFLNRIKNILTSPQNEGARYSVISEKSGKPVDFTFISTEQYGAGMVQKEFESPGALLDNFFSGRAAAERMKQRSGDLLRSILAVYNRTARKLELQKGELAACSEREVFRVKGDLLSANIYRMEKGMNEIAVDNYITGEKETIKLDVRLTPSQNAQKYYSEYKKLDTAEKMLTKLIEQEKQELIYLDSVFDSAARAKTDAELQEIRLELSQSGYLKKGKNKTTESAKPLQPLKFKSKDGFDIWAGRNNLQNDKLTLKTAKGEDLWFHTKDIPGSHVIVFAKGREVPDSTILEAAKIAASNSKAKGGTKIPVDYTKVRYVKKPSGAKPGMVIFTNNKTLLVDGDLE